MSKAESIVTEIVDKVRDYETNMSSFLNNVGEWGDLFRVRRPKAKSDRTFSNPRLSEFFKASRTLGSTITRMQTAQDPYFEVAPLNPLDGSDRLLRIQATMETQLQESQYKRYLLMANTGVVAFGTQIVQEDYEVIGVNNFGRRIPVTTFRPRSLLQVGFDRGATDLDESDWLYTSDLISDGGLMQLASEADVVGTPWNKKVLEFASKEKVTTEELSQHVLNRLNEYGFVNYQDKRILRKELVFYYGKLESMNDGVEYVCAVISRRHLARFHPSKNQHGKRNFRIARWIEDPLSLDPLALGLGALLGNHHKSMDANRQKLQDTISMASYNMWERLRSAGIDDNDLKIRPLQIVDVDERGGLQPIVPNLSGADAALKLEEILKAEFKAASGATDTLQAAAAPSGTTASEVALIQNEALRFISLMAEIIAEPLVREHLRIMHSNNVEFIKKPLNINNSGFAGIVYPVDLKSEIDFRLKISTDRDFKPQRLEKLIQVLQIITSTKSNHPEQMQISVLPIVQEIARALGVPAEKIILPAPMARPPLPGEPPPGNPTDNAMLAGPDLSAEQMSMQEIATPVGPVFGSPVQ